ncbi:MAG: hypothetical protein AAF705_06945 [Bacteroidota bacterium]
MKQFLILCLCFIPVAAMSQTELIILGTVHFPTQNVNADSIFEILEQVKPDVILLESDHSNFNEDYTFKRTYKENEWMAAVKYRKRYPSTLFRPMELEGRNRIRKALGINGNNPVFNHIYYQRKRLSKEMRRDFRYSERLSKELQGFGEANLRTINSVSTDNLVEERQFYVYKKTLEIVNSYPLFEDILLEDNKVPMSAKEYHNKYCTFEERRNHAMSKNILKYVEAFKGKRILVMTGFYHRAELINYLRFEEELYDFRLKEFYDI